MFTFNSIFINFSIRFRLLHVNGPVVCRLYYKSFIINENVKRKM